MGVESEADRAVFTNSGEFGAEVSWQIGAGMPAIFDALYFGRAFGQGVGDGADAMNSSAAIRFSEMLLPTGATADDTNLVTINATAFMPKNILPDGTGWVIVQLEQVL